VRVFPIAFAFCILQGCSKDALETKYATVVYTGTFANGGCEWAISIDSDLFQPRNLPAEFQTDGLNVQVTYRLVQTTAECPNAQNYGGLIHLNRIKRV